MLGFGSLEMYHRGSHPVPKSECEIELAVPSCLVLPSNFILWCDPPLLYNNILLFLQKAPFSLRSANLFFFLFVNFHRRSLNKVCSCSFCQESGKGLILAHTFFPVLFLPLFSRTVWKIEHPPREKRIFPFPSLFLAEAPQCAFAMKEKRKNIF